MSTDYSTTFSKLEMHRSKPMSQILGIWVGKKNLNIYFHNGLRATLKRNTYVNISRN